MHKFVQEVAEAHKCYNIFTPNSHCVVYMPPNIPTALLSSIEEPDRRCRNASETELLLKVGLTHTKLVRVELSNRNRIRRVTIRQS